MVTEERSLIEGFSREWGQKKIDQWKHYLLLDPLTEQGGSSITEYHGFTNKWNECLTEHDDNTPVATLIFELGRLYVKKRISPWGLSLMD